MITFTELLERAKTKEIAIHTPTEKQAKTLLKAFEGKGYIWGFGQKLTAITCYKNYEENTCYDWSYGTVSYCSLSFYQKLGFTIIEFSDIDLEN